MVKLVLFDIDETILHSDGVGRRAMQSALTDVVGSDVDATGHNFSGKTDPQICFELLRLHGFDDSYIEHKLPAVFNRYLSLLEHEITRAHGYRLHSGVQELIDRLSANANCKLALLTGNIEIGARLKLKPFDLNRYFPFGAFGSDAADRLKLPEIAHSRAHQHFSSLKFSREDIVVIGDAVNDILCAKGYSVRSIVTCTGRTPRSELEVLRPDYLFESLTDTDAVCDAIFA